MLNPVPIEIEKGRWRGIPAEQRLCKQCDSGEIETVKHFLMNCDHNKREREELSILVLNKTGTQMNLSVLLCDSRIYKYVADYILNSLRKSRK